MKDEPATMKQGIQDRVEAIEPGKVVIGIPQGVVATRGSDGQVPTASRIRETDACLRVSALCNARRNDLKWPFPIAQRRTGGCLLSNSSAARQSDTSQRAKIKTVN